MRRHFKVSVLKIPAVMTNHKTSLIVVGIASVIAVSMRLINLQYTNFSALGALAVRGSCSPCLAGHPDPARLPIDHRLRTSAANGPRLLWFDGF